MNALVENQKPSRVDRSHVNGKIADSMIRYRFYLTAVENRLVRDVLSVFQPVMKEIDSLFTGPYLLKQLSDARLIRSGETPVNVDQFSIFSGLPIVDGKQNGKFPIDYPGLLGVASVLVDEIVVLLDSLLDVIDELIFSAQIEMVNIVPRILTKIISDHAPVKITDPVEVINDLLDSLSVEQIEVLKEAVGGKNKRALATHRNKAATSIRGILVNVSGAGDLSRATANKVKGAIRKNLANSAARLARTEVQRMAAKAEDQLYRRNVDVIKSEVWMTTLDVDACIVCGLLDGRTFRVSRGPLPIEDTHPNCRCLRSPVIKSWKELGVDASILPAAVRNQLTGRAPERITWRDWFADQDSKTQREILGRHRYELYRDGDLKINDFATSKRILTIKQLARKFDV
jgi:hypothetical protein